MDIFLPFKEGIAKNAVPPGRKSTSGCEVTASIPWPFVQAAKIISRRKNNSILNCSFLISHHPTEIENVFWAAQVRLEAKRI
jgi:hypothetical protein